MGAENELLPESGFWKPRMSSYPKVSFDDPFQATKKWKRRFYSNHFIPTEKEAEEQSISESASASTRKVPSSSSEDISWNPLLGYGFIEFLTISTALFVEETWI